MSQRKTFAQAPFRTANAFKRVTRNSRDHKKWVLGVRKTWSASHIVCLLLKLDTGVRIDPEWDTQLLGFRIGTTPVLEVVMLINALLSLIGEQNTHADDALWSISGWSAATGGDPRSLKPSMKPVPPHHADVIALQVDALRKRAA